MAPKYRFHFDSGDERQDASESAFFSQQLEHIRPQIFNVLYPELKGRLFVPLTTDPVHPGAETYTYRVYNQVGKAEFASDYATDAPRVDIYGSESSVKIRGIRDAYGYSIQEARAAMMARMPLSASKAKAARDAIETKIDDIIFNGKSDLGLTGLLGISSVVTYTTPVGDAGTKTFGTKTPDEVLADLFGIVAGIVTGSSEVESPDTLLLPGTSFLDIATRRLGDGSDTTILKHFLAVNGRVTTVLSSPKLETAGTASSKRMMAYRRSPDKIALIMPQEFEQFPPEQRGMEVLTQCHARTGGVVCYYPKSVSYGDYI